MKIKPNRSAVIALAGRRMDPVGTDPPRFPPENVLTVRRRIAALLKCESATAVVCSAACGADLLSLEAAERLGLRRRIVLPFSPERFRESSVVDRPGDWGPLFDRLIAAAQAAGDLVVLDHCMEHRAAYTATNEAIVAETQKLAVAMPLTRLIGLTVWDGQKRPGNDATEHFRRVTIKAGFEHRCLRTL